MSHAISKKIRLKMFECGNNFITLHVEFKMVLNIFNKIPLLLVYNWDKINNAYHNNFINLRSQQMDSNFPKISKNEIVLEYLIILNLI